MSMHSHFSQSNFNILSNCTRLNAEAESTTFQATVQVPDDYFVRKASVPFKSIVGFNNEQSIASSVKARTIIFVINILTSVIRASCVESFNFNFNFNGDKKLLIDKANN